MIAMGNNLGRTPVDVACSSATSEQSASQSLIASFSKRFAQQAQDFTLDVSFEATAGFTILFGASGAGKTTILDCIAVLATPDSGRIFVGERSLFDAARRRNTAVAHRRAGYVFQSLALFPHMTVEENVGYGLAHL